CCAQSTTATKGCNCYWETFIRISAARR
ncbi:hypothetical protein VCHENC02_4042B, partial [Vibrio harveyi]